jgi:hypothetical protein
MQEPVKMRDRIISHVCIRCHFAILGDMLTQFVVAIILHYLDVPYRYSSIIPICYTSPEQMK